MITLNIENIAVPTVNADEQLKLEGSAGNTYLKYNSTSNKLELWVNGGKKKEWF